MSLQLLLAGMQALGPQDQNDMTDWRAKGLKLPCTRVTSTLASTCGSYRPVAGKGLGCGCWLHWGASAGAGRPLRGKHCPSLPAALDGSPFASVSARPCP